MTAEAQRFAGRAALVTGAAAGIGRAVALRLAAEGAQVLAVDIDAAGLDATRQAADGAVVAHVGDVTDHAQCRAAVAAAVAEFGRLDVLGNVAGIARGEHFGAVTESAYRQMMAVNVDGYFFMAQAAIPHLLPAGGVVVNVASNAGLMGQAYTVVYCMTKGAVVQLTRALAMEYLKTPLRVVALAPGGVDTGLTRGYQMPTDVDWDLVMRYTGQRGMSTPEDMANLFAFLASDEARNIHGTVVSSDGGMTAG
ncbi:MAG: meso-butanediol dehydrogenase / (S,S)-butanediol dehydrogenase / diacetyl reductase [Frankiaceae bacterium]|nr:meso-butanediol dehydrogenase / (S,S)-butanediol dehydrogenase / diacetyl reductase [Frankiaceae bacterium]